MKNKVIVITGGSSGLGKGLAQIFVAKGNKVVICARNKEGLEKVAKEVGATAFVADVTKGEDVQALAGFTVSSFGRIDVWFNNAGVWLPHSPVEELDMERIRAMFEVNVFGVMYGSKSALIQMRKQCEGVIVNIISTSALTGRPKSSGYSASKWAVRGFSNSLLEETRGSKIRVISVYPGYMKTPLFDEDRSTDFDTYMSYESVAEKIVANLEQEEPLEKQVIRRSNR